MSEKPPATPAIPVNQAFDPEERQAQKELDSYMGNRPYEDGKGNIHDPATGSFINSDKYFDGKRDEAMDGNQTAYESMPTTVLAKKLAEAEFNEDRTSAANIEDAMLDKAAAQDEKERERSPERDGKESDKLLDHLEGVKEAELQQRIEKSLESDDDSAETKEDEPSFKHVYYKPNDKKVSTTAVEITKEEEAFDLSALKGGKALLTTEDTTYYVHGGYVDDLMKVRNGKEDEKSGWEVNDTDRLPTIKVGEPLTIHGKKQEGAIKKIEVLIGEQAADALNDSWEARGEDPFAQADALIKEVLGSEEDGTDAIGAANAGESGDDGNSGNGSEGDVLWFEPGGIGQRIRNAFSRNRNEQDNGNRNRRRIMAGVAGLLAVGAVAFGVSEFDHSSNATKELGTLSAMPHKANNEKDAFALGTGGVNFPASTLQGKEARGSGGTPFPVAHTSAHTIELKPGQNPWEISGHRLHELGVANPTNGQIEDYDKLMAHENSDVYAYGDDSSKKIAVGTKIKLPL